MKNKTVIILLSVLAVTMYTVALINFCTGNVFSGSDCERKPSRESSRSGSSADKIRGQRTKVEMKGKKITTMTI